MNRDDTKKVLKILSTAYPKYFSGMDTSDKIDQINLYQTMFGKYDTEVVVTALHDYILNNEYPPSIAGLKKCIDKFMPESETEAELWIYVERITSHGSRVTQEEFDSLPIPVKKWLGDVSQVRELSKMDSGTLNTVVRGQFLKTVPVLVERAKAQAKLPESLIKKLWGDRYELTE